MHTLRIDVILLLSVTSPLFNRSRVAVNSFICSKVSSFMLLYSSSVKSSLKQKDICEKLYLMRLIKQQLEKTLLAVLQIGRLPN